MSASDSDQPQFPLKTLLTDMSPRTRTLIEFYLERSDSRYFAIADTTDTPDVILADLDYPGTAGRIHSLTQRHKAVPVLLAVSEQTIDGAIVVRKPLASNDLETAANGALQLLIDRHRNPPTASDDALEQLNDENDQAYAETMTAGGEDAAIPSMPELTQSANSAGPDPSETPAYFRTTDAALPAPGSLPTEARIERYRAKINLLCGEPRTLEQLADAQSAEHRFDPSDCLGLYAASILFDSEFSLKAVQLKLSESDIYLLPTLQKVYTSVSLEYTRNVHNIFKDWHDHEVSVHKYNSDNVNELVDVLNQSTRYSFSAQAFCWLSALFSANGRLPMGFDINTVCTLHHWPNFTRLELIPDCLEIAAAWSEKPASIVQIIDRVRCEPQHASSFLNAAFTTRVMTSEHSHER